MKGKATGVLCHSKGCVRFRLLTSGADEIGGHRRACGVFRAIGNRFGKVHVSRCLHVLVCVL